MSVNVYGYLGMVLGVKDKVEITEEARRCSNTTCPRHRKSLDESEKFCKHCGSAVETYEKKSLQDFDIEDFCCEYDLDDEFMPRQIEGTGCWLFDDDRICISLYSHSDLEFIDITPEKIAEFEENFRIIPEYVEFEKLLKEHLGEGNYTLGVRYGIYWS